MVFLEFGISNTETHTKAVNGNSRNKAVIANSRNINMIFMN